MGVFDPGRGPKEDEIEAYRARLERLQGRHGEMVQAIADRVQEHYWAEKALGKYGFRIRTGFSFKDQPGASDYSDLKLPKREHRPPATRILSSRGATLRFYMMAMAVAQLQGLPGRQLPALPIVGSLDQLGWTQLVATVAIDQRSKRNFITAQNKRARSIRTSLQSLEDAGLVVLGSSGPNRRYDDFVLLNERGRVSGGDTVPYVVPRTTEDTINLPPEFIRHSWLHVLEDSELVVLLMLLCRSGGLLETDGALAMPSGVRALNYGVGRDTYTYARKTLELFGLVDVEELGRHSDGRADSSEPHRLHRFTVKPAAFESDALPLVIDRLKSQVNAYG